MRFVNKLGPLKVFNNHLFTYPTPMNLNYSWNFGSLAGVVLASQIITGILLAMHYVGHVDLAFNSVVHLMNDVPSGMILRYAHANGASLFFIVVYIHILRGVYYSSGNQPREAVWITGVVILLVMVLTAFIGYVYSQKWILNDANILYKTKKLELNNYDNVYKVYNIYLSFYVSMPITLNTKDHIKIQITPVKSYYNLNLIETQLNIQKENRQKAGIYLVVNNINGNFYVGSAITNRINTRFRNHCIHLKSSNKPLLRAINKYGIKNFSFHIVEYYKGLIFKENLKLSYLKLLERESFYISSLKPIYNFLTIATSSLGFKHNEETRAKIKVNYSLERKDFISNLNKCNTLSNQANTIFKYKANERYADYDFKELFLLKTNHNLFKGKKILLLNPSGVILLEFSSIQQVSQRFSCDRKTIRKYIKSGKKFKNLGYLKLKS